MTSFSIIALCLSILPLLSANIATDKEWDLLLFTQHWPVTVCYNWKEEKASHTCAMPSQKDAWTVHGVWPTKKGTLGPEFCNASWPFNSSFVQPILPQLEQFWTNIEKDTPLESLWKHEWSKHGTCAAVLQSLNNEINYFAQGLRWLQLYSMSDILARSNIIPAKDAEYMPVDVYNAVRNHIGKDPVLECHYDQRTSSNYIFEIRICFDKELNLIDCDGVLGQMQFVNGQKILSNCDVSKSLIYTNVVPIERLVEPTSTLIDIYKFITWLRWFTL